jgi:PTS system mannose-specific IID component
MPAEDLPEMSADNKSLSGRSIFWGTLARSLAVQASWNFEGMQNLGFATMTAPVMGRISRATGSEFSRDEWMEQLEFFNTNPYMSTAIAGLVLKSRSDSGEDGYHPDREAEIKEAFMGPLGALGDEYFWASLRPLAGCAGVLAALAGSPMLGVALFLVLFNIPHFKVRKDCLAGGLSGVDGLMSYMEKADFPGKARRIRLITAGLILLLPFLWPLWDAGPEIPLFWLSAGGASLVILVFVPLLRRFDPRNVVLILTLMLVLIMGLIKVWT